LTFVFIYIIAGEDNQWVMVDVFLPEPSADDWIGVLYSKTQVNHLLLAVNCRAVLCAQYVINYRHISLELSLSLVRFSP